MPGGCGRRALTCAAPATRRTLARIQAPFGGHLPSRAELLAVDPAGLRAAGLSWRKVGTLRDLAERMTDGRLDPEALATRPDDELMAELTAIGGIGPWRPYRSLATSYLFASAFEQADSEPAGIE